MHIIYQSPKKVEYRVVIISIYFLGNLNIRIVYHHLIKLKKKNKNIRSINAVISRLIGTVILYKI